MVAGTTDKTKIPFQSADALSLTRVRKRRSFAVTNKWLRRSSLARQSPGEIQVVPGYGIPRAGRNKGGFRLGGGNRGGFPGEITATFDRLTYPMLTL